MNLKKYISRHFIMQICLLLALVGAAAVFDMYRSTSAKITDNIRKVPVPEDAGDQKIFFCNQVSANNLKTSGTEFPVRFRFAFTQDKFLQKYYNLRTFQLMKAETVHAYFLSVCSFHSLPYCRVLYPVPDDTPPLS